MRRTTLLLLLALLMQKGLGQNPVSRKLDSLFRFFQHESLFNGSVLVAQQGKILLNKGYGLQQWPAGIYNTPQTIYQIYSITKTVTSAVILKLVEEKRLALEDKLSRFYPDFPNADQISIAQLLNHTSGIYDFIRGNDLKDQSEQSFIRFLKTKPLDFAPGTNWSYSNSGYYLLGYIIQQVTGMAYEKAVAQYVFEPLHMQHSGFAFKFLKHPNKATGYAVLSPKRKQPAMVYDPPGPFAAGGIYSTVEDLYKYYKGLSTYQLLQKASLEKAYADNPYHYGLGWVVVDQFNQKTVGHSGNGAGFTSNFVQIPESDICIILLANCEKDLNAITGAVLKVMNNKPYRIPTPKPIPLAKMASYTGAYRVNEKMHIYVRIEDGQLIAQASQQGRTVLYPEKMDQFFVQELDGYIHFKQNAQLQIDTLIFPMQGASMKAAKFRPVWGLIGSATPNGWDGADLPMQPGDAAGVWLVRNIALKQGEIKFRLNSDWTVNLGESGPGKLRYDGDNIVITEGVYDITLDLRNTANPQYRIIKRQ